MSSYWATRVQNIRGYSYEQSEIQLFDAAVSTLTVLENHCVHTVCSFLQKNFSTTSSLIVANLQKGVIEKLTKVVQPQYSGDCVLSLVNPISGQLEWISVSCSKIFSISSLICQKTPKSKTRNLDILYVDSSNFVELHPRTYMGDRVIRACGENTYVFYCEYLRGLSDEMENVSATI